MIEYILINGVPGVFRPVEERKVKDGDYLRLPNKMIFHLLSLKPKIETELVLSEMVPVEATIVDIVDRGY